jgi:hypothetical protein
MLKDEIKKNIKLKKGQKKDYLIQLELTYQICDPSYKIKIII